MEIPGTVFRKTALWLFGISLLAGFGSTALFMGHRLPVETWRIMFILALVVLTNAIWFGWMPVGVAAIALALVLFAFVRRTDWYNSRFYRTPTWVMLVAFAGFAAALFLGIFMTEQVPPAQSGQLLRAEENVDYRSVIARPD